MTTTELDDIKTLIEALRRNPMMYRHEIAQHFPNFDYAQLSNLLTRARRNDVISHTGGRTYAQWFVKDHHNG